MKKILTGLLILGLGFGMSGCANISGIKFNLPNNKMYKKKTYKHYSNTKIRQNYKKSCRGIRILRAGKDRFRGMVPYQYVSIVNNSNERKEITLDLKWRKTGSTYFGAYNDSSWRTFGPEVLRPGETARFVIDKSGRRGLFLEEVAVGKCE